LFSLNICVRVHAERILRKVIQVWMMLSYEHFCMHVSLCLSLHLRLSNHRRTSLYLGRETLTFTECLTVVDWSLRDVKILLLMFLNSSRASSFAIHSLDIDFVLHELLHKQFGIQRIFATTYWWRYTFKHWEFIRMEEKKSSVCV
jgi:hypothetical protein